MWILRRLKMHGAGPDDLLDVYQKQVRSVLELAVPAWHPGLTQSDALDIERVQKAALHIILGADYHSYSSVLKVTNLKSLSSRREALCLNFGKKNIKNEKYRKWFKMKTNFRTTRQSKQPLCDVVARTTRFKNSPISYLTRLLNQHFTK